jgi:hypothetical protein
MGRCSMNQLSGTCALQRKEETRWAIDAHGSGPILGGDEGNAGSVEEVVSPAPIPRWLGDPETWLVESWSGLKIAVSLLGDVRRAIG